jgi:hypothetical protein
MAIITEPIGEQGFEKVANRIAEILTIEIANQVTIQSFPETVEGYLERIEPFDKSEDVMFSVALREDNFDGYTQKDSQGGAMFFIDLFCSGYGEGSDVPSIVSAKKMYRYAGLIRYILSSGKMPTLGFPPGLIGGKYIKKFMVDTDYSNFGNHSNYDGAYIRFCRFIFIVRVQENQQLWEGIPLQGNTTNISYEDTPKGTQLIFTN